MTIPEERTRSILQTREFLQDLLNPREYPRVPRAVREEARRLLRHYPLTWEVERAHEAVPHLYGPALEKKG
jgi:hypothetical protein